MGEIHIETRRRVNCNAHRSEIIMNTATPFASAFCIKADLPATALLALCVLASAAEAAPPSDTAPVTRSAKVSLAGLDLSTPDGARAARERLRVTARRLCARVADDLDLSHHANFVACVDETLAAALRRATELDASTATAKSAQSRARSISQAYPRSP
jgi:UrcA family protein